MTETVHPSGVCSRCFSASGVVGNVVLSCFHDGRDTRAGPDHQIAECRPTPALIITPDKELNRAEGAEQGRVVVQSSAALVYMLSC